MKYADISPTMRNFLGGFEVLRALGFQSDDIFFLIAGSAQTYQLAAFCVLKTQGKEFSIECGPINSQASAAAEYKKVAEALSKKEVENLEQIVFESEAYVKKVELIMAIGSKGIRIPDERVN